MNRERFALVWRYIYGGPEGAGTCAICYRRDHALVWANRGLGPGHSMGVCAACLPKASPPPPMLRLAQGVYDLYTEPVSP